MSSATVRNDLAQLESYGFVHQPHTSRVAFPPIRATVLRRPPRAGASFARRPVKRIDSFFQEVHQQISDVLTRHVVVRQRADRLPGGGVGPAMPSDMCKDVRLVPLGGSIVLVWPLPTSGRVHQEFVDIGIAPDARHARRCRALDRRALSRAPLDARRTKRLPIGPACRCQASGRPREGSARTSGCPSGGVRERNIADGCAVERSCDGPEPARSARGRGSLIELMTDDTEDTTSGSVRTWVGE